MSEKWTYVILSDDYRMLVHAYDSIIHSSQLYVSGYNTNITYTRTDFLKQISKELKKSKCLSISLFRRTLKRMYTYVKN